MYAQKIEDVEKFAGEHKKIVCYGASDHGHMVKHYLEMKGYIVEEFWITDPIEIGTIRDGVPVHSVGDIEKITLECGVVLSLYERHHEEVIKSLIKKGADESSICAIPDLMQHEMHRKVLLKRRIDILSTKINLSLEEEKKYIFFAERLFNEYKNIKMMFFSAWRLGHYALWIAKIAERCRKNDDKSYYLFYPVAQEHYPDKELICANGYLLTLLHGKGLEMLSRSNIKFWQYMYQRYHEKFVFNDIYDYMAWSNEDLEHYDEIQNNEGVLSFSADEEIRGGMLLESLGIEDQYVCISNRDPAFLQTEKRDIVKPDFRDIYRNSDIETRSMAIDYLREQGIQSVRMGARVQSKWNYPNLIDSTNDKRTEFADVYLNSKAKFFIGDLTGIMTFAMLCAKPVLILNAPVFTTRYDAMLFLMPDRDIAIIKKLYDKRHGRYLTIREMLDYEVNKAVQEKNGPGAVFWYYYEHDIVPVDNSKEEILEATIEMNERIEKKYNYDSLDDELQIRYREIVDSFDLNGAVLNKWRLGAKFLRDNQWLLQ
ncbi:MAG: TIGR04372 family glycosyltransferase [Pseudobutyrivibrio sp.]|nr:TIGR04372 family glycosyltransferase [Pseudobutyrivibrio sp.]